MNTNLKNVFEQDLKLFDTEKQNKFCIVYINDLKNLEFFKMGISLWKRRKDFITQLSVDQIYDLIISAFNSTINHIDNKNSFILCDKELLNFQNVTKSQLKSKIKLSKIQQENLSNYPEEYKFWFLNSELNTLFNEKDICDSLAWKTITTKLQPHIYKKDIDLINYYCGEKKIIDKYQLYNNIYNNTYYVCNNSNIELYNYILKKKNKLIKSFTKDYKKFTTLIQKITNKMISLLFNNLEGKYLSITDRVLLIFTTINYILSESFNKEKFKDFICRFYNPITYKMIYNICKKHDLFCIYDDYFDYSNNLNFWLFIFSNYFNCNIYKNNTEMWGFHNIISYQLLIPDKSNQIYHNIFKYVLDDFHHKNDQNYDINNYIKNLQFYQIESYSINSKRNTTYELYILHQYKNYINSNYNLFYNNKLKYSIGYKLYLNKFIDVSPLYYYNEYI